MGCEPDGWDSKQKNGKPLREIIRLDGKRARSWGGDEIQRRWGQSQMEHKLEGLQVI